MLRNFLKYFKIFLILYLLKHILELCRIPLNVLNYSEILQYFKMFSIIIESIVEISALSKIFGNFLECSGIL